MVQGRQHSAADSSGRRAGRIEVAVGIHAADDAVAVHPDDPVFIGRAGDRCGIVTDQHGCFHVAAMRFFALHLDHITGIGHPQQTGELIPGCRLTPLLGAETEHIQLIIDGLGNGSVAPEIRAIHSLDLRQLIRGVAFPGEHSKGHRVRFQAGDGGVWAEVAVSESRYSAYFCHFGDIRIHIRKGCRLAGGRCKYAGKDG